MTELKLPRMGPLDVPSEWADQLVDALETWAKAQSQPTEAQSESLHKAMLASFDSVEPPAQAEQPEQTERDMLVSMNTALRAEVKRLTEHAETLNGQLQRMIDRWEALSALRTQRFEPVEDGSVPGIGREGYGKVFGPRVAEHLRAHGIGLHWLDRKRGD